MFYPPVYRVAMEQAHRRGWLTYTDLSAVWDNSDVQLYMLKHIAKVIRLCVLDPAII